MIRRYILILGAMKSGTTTLFDHLSRHPSIAGAKPKESGFFAFDDVVARGLDWYDGIFPADEHTIWRLDGSTDYAKFPFVTGIRQRMAAVPDAEFRLLYIMRDPLARIESHARHVQRTKKEIGQQISPRTDHSLDAGLSPVSLAISDYALQLDQWRDECRKGQLHCLTLEALSGDPEATMAGVWDFLELEPVTGPLPLSNRAEDRQEMHPLAARIDRLTAGRSAARLLPKQIKNRLRHAFRRPVEVEGRFKLGPEEHALLTRLYAPSLERLEAEWDIEVSAWRSG